MDARKVEKIQDFLMMWNYTPEQLQEYLQQVAPELPTDGQRARDEQTRAFFDQVFGREHKAKAATPIPKPEDLNAKGIGYDLWLLLGLGENAITLDDLADYSRERLAKIEANRKQEAADSGMAMSNMLRGLNEDERIENARFIAELSERAERLRNQNTNMSQLLRDLHTQADSTPRTISLGSGPKAGENDMNDHMRRLNPDNRS